MVIPSSALLLALPGMVGSTFALLPGYTARRPNYQKPYGGLPPLLDARHSVVFEASSSTNTYNHQPQIERHGGAFHVAWKSSPFNEDEDGQNILYSSSTDGKRWSPAFVLFPSLPAWRFGCNRKASFCFDKIHHESSPFVTLNGRLYAVSNVRRHGSPGEFFPIPADSMNTTLIRRVLHPAQLTPGGCRAEDPRSICPINEPCACPPGSMRWVSPSLGPIWWATEVVPHHYENLSSAVGIRPSISSALNPEEKADLELFRNPLKANFYAKNACRNGHCPEPKEGEQTVYAVNASPFDVTLYRGTGGSLPHGWPGDQGCEDAVACVLLATSRNTTIANSPWASITPTKIPDLGSNLDAGSLADGRVFLVWNGVPRPHVNDSAACGGRLTALRNPLTLAIASDGGYKFDRVFALYNSTTPKRYCGSAKSFGPSYPQAREVTGEGPSMDGLWIVYSINKEDIGVTFAPVRILK